MFYFFLIRGILLLHGVVAHLGERIAGSDEVESSSLFGSTFLMKWQRSVTWYVSGKNTDDPAIFFLSFWYASGYREYRETQCQ